MTALFVSEGFPHVRTQGPRSEPNLRERIRHDRVSQERRARKEHFGGRLHLLRQRRRSDEVPGKERSLSLRVLRRSPRDREVLLDREGRAVHDGRGEPPLGEFLDLPLQRDGRPLARNDDAPHRGTPEKGRYDRRQRRLDRARGEDSPGRKNRGRRDRRGLRGRGEGRTALRRRRGQSRAGRQNALSRRSRRTAFETLLVGLAH